VGDVTVVTGGTGFVGAAVVAPPDLRGYRVRVLARSAIPATAHRASQLKSWTAISADADSSAVSHGCRLLSTVRRCTASGPGNRAPVLRGQFFRGGNPPDLRAAAEAGVGRVWCIPVPRPLGFPKDGRPGTEETYLSAWPTGVSSVPGARPVEPRAPTVLVYTHTADARLCRSPAEESGGSLHVDLVEQAPVPGPRWLYIAATWKSRRHPWRHRRSESDPRDRRPRFSTGSPVAVRRGLPDRRQDGAPMTAEIRRRTTAAPTNPVLRSQPSRSPTCTSWQDGVSAGRL